MAHRRVETCLVGFINRLVLLFDSPHIRNNLEMVLTDTEKNFDVETLGVSHLLALITDRFHHDLRKGQPSVAHFGLVFLAYILQNQLVAAYELAYHLCHSLLLALPRTNQGWNCAMGHVTKTMMDQIVGVLGQVIQLQFIVAVLDALGREHSKQDMFQHLHTTNDACSLNHSLLDTLIAHGRRFILSFRSLIPTISYAIRAVLLHLSVFVRYVSPCLSLSVSLSLSRLTETTTGPTWRISSCKTGTKWIGRRI